MTETVNIQVKRGVKVNVQEVDHLDNDRVMVASAPKGLKIAIHQVEGVGSAASASKITMCG